MWQRQISEGKIISNRVRDIIKGHIRQSFIGHHQDFGLDSE